MNRFPVAAMLRIKFSNQLKALSNENKIVIAVVADSLVLIGCVLVSYALRVSDFALPSTQALPRYLVAPALSVVAMALADIYRHSFRSFTGTVQWHLIVSQLVMVPAWAFVLLLMGMQDFARSVVIIYAVLAILSLDILRRFAALILGRSSLGMPPRQRIPLIIIGAGPEGLALADALDRQGSHSLTCFFDTDYTLVGRKVAGKPVLELENLENSMRTRKAQEALIAMPELSRAGRRKLVDRLLAMGLVVKTVPGLGHLLATNLDVDAIRPISVSDLLGRDPVPPDQKLMEKNITNKVVLISGSGGSIGSELVRQISNFAPRKVVLLDISEFALFEIHREMERLWAGKVHKPEIVPLLADVKDADAMQHILASQGVQVVFHAAAYKHVRMVQENAEAGVRNNVWGTLTLAEAAIAAEVELFVLISTDKAVRPTSVMGASKRVAEMCIQALAARPGKKPIFTMVRFGNVLGSTGSVVPLFKEQIERGGPVTVTHPDVTRYFMLIPEAAQLVIQAAAMAEGGEVFVLDMGEPIKITQLAKTMVEIAGRSLRTPQNPEGDIQIRFTGLRDGEKLYEELQIGHDISATGHPRIMKSREQFLKWGELQRKLTEGKKLVGAKGDAGLAAMVMQLANIASAG